MKKFMIKSLKILKYAVILFLLWFAAHAAFITADGLTGDVKKSDAAVVFGSKVNEDGTLSERLQKRMECALDIYNSGKTEFIIVSGGLGKEGHYEGSAMKEFLAEKGVPEERIIVDDNGDNTLATVKNAIDIAGKYEIKSIIAVSQYFHITRAKMTFKKYGFKNVSGASPKYFEIMDIYSILREFGGYYAYLFK
jgi:vancomycin permeability regulator SanA